MRYEAKHSYFKKLAQSMGNFINISFTLATRHQLNQCYDNTTSPFTGAVRLTIGPGMLIQWSTLKETNVGCVIFGIKLFDDGHLIGLGTLW